LVKAATGDTVMLNLIDYEAKYYVN